MQYEPHPVIYSTVRFHKGPKAPKPPPPPPPPPILESAAQNLAKMKILERQNAARGYSATMFASRQENADKPVTLMQQIMEGKR